MNLPARMSRRAILGFSVAATAAIGLSGCASGSQNPASAPSSGDTAGADSGAFPVTIKHAFGETTIDKVPAKVATLGWSDQDNVLALGVVPVGATAMTWGGNAAQSTDWFDAELTAQGGAQPTRYDDTDGAPVEELAKLAPDLILATNSGITADEYEKLSKIAPVVAYPGAPWVTSWQNSLTMTGQALGRSDKAAEVKAATEQGIADGKAKFPALSGASFVFAYLTAADLSTIGIYGPQDNRVRILNEFGMANPPIVTDSVKEGEFYGQVSAERASTVESDILLTYAETPGDLNTFKNHPLIGQIPALRDGHAYAEADKRIGLSITNPTPLSVPFIIDRFLPKVADVAPTR